MAAPRDRSGPPRRASSSSTWGRQTVDGGPFASKRSSRSSGRAPSVDRSGSLTALPVALRVDGSRLRLEVNARQLRMLREHGHRHDVGQGELNHLAVPQRREDDPRKRLGESRQRRASATRPGLVRWADPPGAVIGQVPFGVEVPAIKRRAQCRTQHPIAPVPESCTGSPRLRGSAPDPSDCMAWAHRSLQLGGSRRFPRRDRSPFKAGWSPKG